MYRYIIENFLSSNKTNDQNKENVIYLLEKMPQSDFRTNQLNKIKIIIVYKIIENFDKLNLKE